MTAPPECPTCHPRWAPSPSGGTWFHRRPCHDGAQIGGYQRARRNHPAQGSRRPLRAVSHLDPAYVDAHMDDEDDERGGMAS